MSLDLKHIIQECLRGNRVAQKELFQLYNGKLFKSACTYLNDEENAKGIVQETWIDIFKGLDGYDINKSQPITWMKTILIRKVWKANKKNRKTEELDHNHSFYNHQSQIIDQLSCQEILNEMDKIPEASRLVFKLFVLEEYSHAEISAMLEISESTSRVHLTKARNILRNRHNIINKVFQK